MLSVVSRALSEGLSATGVIVIVTFPLGSELQGRNAPAPPGHADTGSRVNVGLSRFLVTDDVSLHRPQCRAVGEARRPHGACVGFLGLFGGALHLPSAWTGPCIATPETASAWSRGHFPSEPQWVEVGVSISPLEGGGQRKATFLAASGVRAEIGTTALGSQAELASQSGGSPGLGSQMGSEVACPSPRHTGWFQGLLQGGGVLRGLGTRPALAFEGLGVGEILRASQRVRPPHLCSGDGLLRVGTTLP